MDVYCPYCGEPWENDYLHEVALERGTDYYELLNDFICRGCPVLENSTDLTSVIMFHRRDITLRRYAVAGRFGGV